MNNDINSHNSMLKHTKNKFIHSSISRHISSQEITPIRTPTVPFMTDMDVLIVCHIGDPRMGYQSYITSNM